MNVAEKLEDFRTEQVLTRGISFASIVAFGPHGALPHYTPTNLTDIGIDKSNLLVIDSGGHYMGKSDCHLLNCFDLVEVLFYFSFIFFCFFILKFFFVYYK